MNFSFGILAVNLRILLNVRNLATLLLCLVSFSVTLAKKFFWGPSYIFYLHFVGQLLFLTAL